MARFQGFIGPSYTLRSVNADCERSVNLFPEINENKSETAGEAGLLIKSPGLNLAVALATSPVRATYKATDGVLYAVGGNKLYSISTKNVATEIGTLNTSNGLVSIADNGTQMMLVDGPYGYLYVSGTGSFSQITDPDFTGADIVTFQDGYFIFNIPNSGKFGITALYDGASIDGLDFATAEGAPDNVISLISDHRELWLFGDRTIEVFQNTGAASFPFERIQGAFIEHGCAAKGSVCKADNHIYWMGQDDKGACMVFANNGYQPFRVSNHAVETALQTYRDISNAIAHSYQEGGHTFYVLNFPSANATWVYDVTTQVWHERAYWNTTTGAYERQRQNCHAFSYGYHYVGDYANGNVYTQSLDYQDDNGAPIRWMRTAPHINSDMNFIYYHQFQLDMEVGTGIDGSGQGSDPTVILQWSNDSGHSWSTEKFAQMGKLGEFRKRAIWNMLGRARDRVFRVSGSDPVKIVLLGANVTTTKGSN